VKKKGRVLGREVASGTSSGIVWSWKISEEERIATKKPLGDGREHECLRIREIRWRAKGGV